ncbi:zinc ribbon domain-containing protein [Campylobacter hyointestinalis]
MVYEQKDKLLLEMNQKVLTFYEKIRKWAKNTAVVPVKKQACYGCFMKINDKTYANVIKSEDIVTCPHCGRILYKDSE